MNLHINSADDKIDSSKCQLYNTNKFHAFMFMFCLYITYVYLEITLQWALVNNFGYKKQLSTNLLIFNK